MSCEISDYSNDVESNVIRKARKEHRCCACHEKIRPGDRYDYLFVVFEGEADSFKRCLRCKAIYKELVDRLGDSEEGVAYALDCGHDWEEIHDEPLPEHLAAMAFMNADEIQAAFAAQGDSK